ncbi:GNAT family N-acetyltransferase [Eisenbergiella porci]|uniref:GNAT family N-acetyltransferase n=1 Tax=Eisenbergiella porci TaxID=2652274 RepID=UPI003AB92315
MDLSLYLFPQSSRFRGNRISRQLIECAADYAKEAGFTRVYIPSGITGLYEKYGFQKIDVLMNYGGDTDNIFMRNC